MTPAVVSEYERMKQNLEHFRHEVGKLHSRVATLEDKNASLLEALKMAQMWLDWDGRYDMQGINAAIRKATGAK